MTNSIQKEITQLNCKTIVVDYNCNRLYFFLIYIFKHQGAVQYHKTSLPEQVGLDKMLLFKQMDIGA